MHRYVKEQGSKLLRRLIFRLHRAATSRDPEAIHDLRVAIRRFQQFLRVFEQFLPRAKVKKIRPQLRAILKLSGEVRNRDIASALLKKNGGSNDSPLSMTLARQRRQAQSELLQLIARLHARDVARKWHSKLRF